MEDIRNNGRVIIVMHLRMISRQCDRYVLLSHFRVSAIYCGRSNSIDVAPYREFFRQAVSRPFGVDA